MPRCGASHPSTANPASHACCEQDKLQNTVGGGKPKMRYHFNNNGWPASILGPAPESEEARTRLIDELQVRWCSSTRAGISPRMQESAAGHYKDHVLIHDRMGCAKPGQLYGRWLCCNW